MTTDLERAFQQTLIDEEEQMALYKDALRALRASLPELKDKLGPDYPRMLRIIIRAVHAGYRVLELKNGQLDVVAEHARRTTVEGG